VAEEVRNAGMAVQRRADPLPGADWIGDRFDDRLVDLDADAAGRIEQLQRARVGRSCSIQ